MFKKFSYFLIEKYQELSEMLHMEFSKDPKKEKMFNWVLGNNPLSGYDISTYIVLTILLALIGFIIKVLF